MADDQSIEAIYTILKGNIQRGRFSDDELKECYERRAEYLNNSERTFTVEEAHNIIRQTDKH